jgi:hypothetical protein
MKYQRETKTMRELMDLYDADKLIDYPYSDGEWSDEGKKNYLELIKNGMYYPPSLIVYQNTDNIFEIVDERHKWPLVLSYFKSIPEKETIKLDEIDIIVNIITEAKHEEILNMIWKSSRRIPLNEPEKRRGILNSNKREMLKKLQEHSFFKECLIQGETIRQADRDCLEILLAFLWCIEEENYNKVDKETLPSNLKKIAKEEPDEPGDYDKAWTILDFMTYIFSGTKYTCRAIDFCYMAILYKYFIEYYDIEAFNTRLFNIIFSKYIKLISQLDPCITLNPLAKENMEILMVGLSNMMLDIHMEKEEEKLENS